MKTQVRFVGKKVSAMFRKMAKSLPNEILDEMRLIAEDTIKPDFEKTTRTWNNKPEFTVEVIEKPARVKVTTDSDIYRFIDRGTRVRYAVMSGDWKSKTSPGVIGSSGGRGRMLFVSRKRPMPGIKARNFTDIINKNAQTKVPNRIRARLKRGIEAAGL